MYDVASLDGWQSKFEAWVEFAKPLLPQGKAKEAFAEYPWFTTEGEPFGRLTKPASETRFGLLTTGGYSIDGEQDPVFPAPRFDDTTPDLRLIPMDVDRGKLVIHHFGYDHRFAKEDHNVNLPLDRLREMEAAGEIGSIAETTHVLMGLVVDVAPMLEKTIPALIEKLRADAVEAALLVPS